jgi:hypothetical protein
MEDAGRGRRLRPDGIPGPAFLAGVPTRRSRVQPVPESVPCPQCPDDRPLDRPSAQSDGRDDGDGRPERHGRLAARHGHRPLPRARRPRRGSRHPRHRDAQGHDPRGAGVRPPRDRPVAATHGVCVVVERLPVARRAGSAARRHRALLDVRHVPLQRRLSTDRRRCPRRCADRQHARGAVPGREHRLDVRDDGARRPRGRSRRRLRRDGLGCAASKRRAR